MNICNRCEKNYVEDGLNWHSDSKHESIAINLCGSCCANLIVIAMQIYAIDRVDLQLYANKQTDRLMQRHLNALKPEEDIRHNSSSY